MEGPHSTGWGTSCSICDPPLSYLKDCFSIGALNAFINEGFVSASAGNVGATGSVVNASLWVLTVAANCGVHNLESWDEKVCEKSVVVTEQGDAGMVLISPDIGTEMTYNFAVLTMIIIKKGEVDRDMCSTNSPVASFLFSEDKVKPNLRIVIFSSKGSLDLVHYLLTSLKQPDITAPGVNILAAYPPFFMSHDQHVKIIYIGV
ncbi:hypothetical protein CMV_021220 [Castanea mollissima]|uniref:Uncharacterized protein n=1 Tax=Castanea mollissima TaxID=60419 RepID=A0A8J4QLN8_9ROSI|nr:hypothetical protein CMV_021220 [Castanea mollissima]